MTSAPDYNWKCFKYLCGTCFDFAYQCHCYIKQLFYGKSFGKQQWLSNAAIKIVNGFFRNINKFASR